MKFAQSSMVYFNYSLPYAMHRLSAIGYDGIEIWGGRPHMYRDDLDAQLPQITDILNETGLSVCNFIPAQYRYPSLLCSLNEHVRTDSVGYIETALKNAEAVASPSVSLCPGMVPWDEDVAEGRRQLTKSLKEIHAINQDYGRLLLIEPAHQYETNLILTVAQCVELVGELGLDDFGVLLDTGHCNVNGEDITEAVAVAANLPLHIHIDDNNGDRDAHLMPGEGNADLAATARALAARGYNGFVSAELGPAYITEPDEAARETLARLRALFR